MISPTIDSIAPTEFLKGWSAASHARRFRRNHFRYIHPSRGGNLRFDTRKNAETKQGCPQRSGEYLAKPVIHRPQMAPTDEINGASVPIEVVGAYCQSKAPATASRSRPAQGGVLRSVNFTGRYIGNKACNQGTQCQKAEQVRSELEIAGNHPPETR